MLAASSSDAISDMRRAEQLVGRLDRQQALSPLLKQLMSSWEDYDSALYELRELTVGGCGVARYAAAR